MTMDATETPKRTSPEDVPVQLNVKVPWHYREQLIRTAHERGISLNRLVVNALVRSYPPER
jgi:predicted HicB family RNase H-like nuclease